VSLSKSAKYNVVKRFRPLFSIYAVMRSALFTGLFLLLSSILCIPLKAAGLYPVKIQWSEKPRTFQMLNLKEVSMPDFEGAYHSEDLDMLPKLGIRLSQPMKGKLVGAVLENAVYEPFSPPAGFPAEKLRSIPSLQYSVAVAKKRYSAFFTVFPFRLNPQSGQPERLLSANISYQYVPEGSSRSSASYAAHSKLASGNWYQLRIPASGVYRIDASLLQSLGMGPGSVEFSKAGVFGARGGMVPDENAAERTDDLGEFPVYRFDGNNNNRFDAGDYLLFYAEGPDVWKYDSLQNSFSHLKNLYSDFTYVFFTPESGSGKTWSRADFSGNVNTEVNTYDDLYFFEEELFNPLKSGRQWFGENLSTLNNSADISLNVNGFRSENGFNAKLRTAVIGRSTLAGLPISVRVSANGSVLHTHNLPTVGPDYTDTYASFSSLITTAPVSGQYNLNFSFSSSNSNAEAWVDFVELLINRPLRMYSSQLMFRSSDGLGASSIAGYNVSEVGQDVLVADVTDPVNAFLLNSTNSGGNLRFVRPANSLREYLLFSPSGSFPVPAAEGKIANQDLHGLSQADMIIVCPPEFRDAAEGLAQIHRSDGLESVVVSVQDIYREFGAGRPDLSSIRDMMRMLYDRAGSDTSKMPRYLLLYGDASYDYKNRLSNNTNWVPTYQSFNTLNPISTYNTDDFFGLLDENEGGEIANGNQPELMDLGVGRLVASNVQEAYDMLAKIRTYREGMINSNSCNTVNSNGNWRNMVTFVGDDEDGNIHQVDADRIAESARSRHPEFNYDKIYLDAFTQVNTPAGNRYPGVNEAILNRLNSGTLIMNYVGHGGTSGWALERIFNLSEITSLRNLDKLPLFVTATCEFSKFDDPDKKSAGELLAVNSRGGAIALITTLRLVFSSQNYTLNSSLFNKIFDQVNGHDPSLGELMTATKNSIFSDANNRKFVLMGDPALTIHYPRYDVVTTTLNERPIGSGGDTLKALKEVKIGGEVRDANGLLLSNFNGTIYPVVYDKLSTVNTLAQDPQSRKMNFKLFRSILFRGKAGVTNGKFSFSFIVPKDIDYQIGNGRISYYASSGSADAHGFSENILIGGSADSFAIDKQGPDIRVYMNDERFVNGGTTNENPMLLVLLGDSSGINTAGNGVGRDLVGILDNNERAPLILNDYYESEMDNFRRGQIRYPFSKLADGRHTLKVKAWDVQNNSGEELIEFVVAGSEKIALKHVYNYPNPFTSSTRFMLEHNQACKELTITIRIFSVSGKLVKTLQRQSFCEGYRIDDIYWNGLDEFNDPLGKGVYIYQALIADREGNKAGKFEKLVVLR